MEVKDKTHKRHKDQDDDCEDCKGDVSTVKLERNLGLFDGVMINVGIMVGTGIFVSPKGVLAGVGSVGATLCVWVAAGIMSLIGALCFAELGTMIPASGGTYTYIRVIFGDLLGFLTLWAEGIFASACGRAVTSLLFSSYCLEPFFPDPECPPPKIAIQLFAVLCGLITMFFNGWSVKLSSRIQNILSICKLLSLGIIIISGFVNIGKGQVNHFKHPFASTTIAGLGSALFSGLYSYSGWHCLNSVTEELKNPMKNLPLAIALSILTVIIVNTLANVAYFTVLSPSELLQSDAVAFSYAEKVLGRFSVIVPVVIALSCFGSLNAALLSHSRYILAGAREGHLPKTLAMIGVRHKTPLPSVIISAILMSILCFVENIFTLINFFSFQKWLSFGISVIGLLILRYREPDRPRPFKNHIVIPIVFVMVFLCLIVFGFYSAPLDSLIATAIFLSGIPIYIFMVRLNLQIKWMTKMRAVASLFLQKVLLIAPEESLDG